MVHPKMCSFWRSRHLIKMNYNLCALKLEKAIEGNVRFAGRLYILELSRWFDRLPHLGVKQNIKTLCLIEWDFAKQSRNDAYYNNMVDEAGKQNQVLNKITTFWILSSMPLCQIVNRALTKKHRASTSKENKIEIDGAHHLGMMPDLLCSKTV